MRQLKLQCGHSVVTVPLFLRVHFPMALDVGPGTCSLDLLIVKLEKSPNSMVEGSQWQLSGRYLVSPCHWPSVIFRKHKVVKSV